MRASGYSETLGFTVYDTLIYKRNLERLVSEEVGVMMERLAGEMDTDEAADLLERAVEPMRDLVAAMRAKLLIAELRARRARAASSVRLRQYAVIGVDRDRWPGGEIAGSSRTAELDRGQGPQPRDCGRG